MPPKREQSITVRLSDDEAHCLRKKAADWNMDVSDVLRACIAISLPVMSDVSFIRRVRLEDNKTMSGMQ